MKPILPTNRMAKQLDNLDPTPETEALTKEAVLGLIQEELAKSNKQIEDLLKPLQEQLTNTVVDLVQPLQTKLEELETKPQANPENQPNPLEQRLKTYEKQMADLQDALKAKDEQAKQLRFSDSLNGLIAKYNPMFPDQVKSLLNQQLAGQFVESDGKWLSKEGKTLDEVATGFFDSDFGKHMLKPQVQSGAGLDNPTKDSGAKKIDLNAAIKSVFG